jgi:hypothetical protein
VDCPFRTDIRPYLRPERVDEIRLSLVRAEFPCHRTINRDSVPENDDGESDMDLRDTTGEAHCAGALILLEKIEEPSQMMRIGERLRMYDRRKLDMKAPVFNTFQEMRDAMEEEQTSRRRPTKKASAKTQRRPKAPAKARTRRTKKVATRAR